MIRFRWDLHSCVSYSKHSPSMIFYFIQWFICFVQWQVMFCTGLHFICGSTDHRLKICKVWLIFETRWSRWEPGDLDLHPGAESGSRWQIQKWSIGRPGGSRWSQLEPGELNLYPGAESGPRSQIQSLIWIEVTNSNLNLDGGQRFKSGAVWPRVWRKLQGPPLPVQQQVVIKF